MKRFFTILLTALATVSLAAPAVAQDDPYGEVLPRDVEQPGDETVPPGAVGPAGEARQPAPVQPAERLPRTGLANMTGALVLGLALLGGGGAAVLLARRRRRSAHG